MASIRNRNGVWQARVIRKGHAPVTKSFHSKQDARQWARIASSSEFSMASCCCTLAASFLFDSIFD